MQPVENLCRICIRTEEQERSSFVSIFGTTLEFRDVQEEREPDGDDALVRTVAEVMARCLDVDVRLISVSFIVAFKIGFCFSIDKAKRPTSAEDLSRLQEQAPGVLGSEGNM